MFLKRTSQEILKDAARLIAKNSKVTNFYPGSIARSIVEAMAPEIGSTNDKERVSLYDFAQQVLDEGFLSKATGMNLDLIGGLFNYPRRSEQVLNEQGTLVQKLINDELYRYEIAQVVPAMATANYAALRLALLTVDGVKDVIGREYTHGTGSFSFIFIPLYGYDEATVLSNMKSVIDKTKAYGVRPNIILLEKVLVDLTVKLIFHETTSTAQKENVRFIAQSKIKNFLGLHERGQQLIYNDLVQEIMNAHEKIIDFEITKFYVNNEPVLLTNQSILEDERIAPQNIQVI